MSALQKSEASENQGCSDGVAYKGQKKGKENSKYSLGTWIWPISYCFQVL
jgi:hypothetical protein